MFCGLQFSGKERRRNSKIQKYKKILCVMIMVWRKYLNQVGYGVGGNNAESFLGEILFDEEFGKEGNKDV